MKLATSFAFTLAFALVPSFASAALAGRPDANVSFTAIGPAGMSIVGTTRDLTVQEDTQGVISVTVLLRSLTTGIDLRDKHMREKYLEVPKYPTAILKVARTSLKVPGDGDSGSFEADGSLTLHGQTKSVHFRYTAKHDATTFGVKGSLTLDMNDYGIETPKYLGISVKPKVDLTVSFTADDKT